MNATATPHRLLITAPDMERLRRLVDSHLDDELAWAAEQLDLELDRASVVPQAEIPPDVVTMRARVVVEQPHGRRELVLAYPEEADPAASKVSVLSPVGMAVLGLSVGDEIDWPLPNGSAARLRVLEVRYQPEAAGDLHL